MLAVKKIKKEASGKMPLGILSVMECIIQIDQRLKKFTMMGILLIISTRCRKWLQDLEAIHTASKDLLTRNIHLKVLLHRLSYPV